MVRVNVSRQVDGVVIVGVVVACGEGRLQECRQKGQGGLPLHCGVVRVDCS